MKLIVGILLYFANATELFHNKKINFYPMKKCLLGRFGTYEKLFYQQIDYPCFSCGGIGTREGEDCPYCDNGTFVSEIIRHQSYKLAGFHFLVPLNKARKERKFSNALYENYLAKVNMHGKIQRRDTAFLGREAFFVLSLLFDRTGIRDEFGYIRSNYLLPFFPFTFVETWVATIGILKRKILRYFSCDYATYDLPF